MTYLKVLEWNINQRSKNVKNQDYVLTEVLRKDPDIAVLVEFKSEANKRFIEKMDDAYYIKYYDGLGDKKKGNGVFIAVKRNIISDGKALEVYNKNAQTLLDDLTNQNEVLDSNPKWKEFIKKHRTWKRFLNNNPNWKKSIYIQETWNNFFKDNDNEYWDFLINGTKEDFEKYKEFKKSKQSKELKEITKFIEFKKELKKLKELKKTPEFATLTEDEKNEAKEEFDEFKNFKRLIYSYINFRAFVEDYTNWKRLLDKKTTWRKYLFNQSDWADFEANYETWEKYIFKFLNPAEFTNFYPDWLEVSFTLKSGIKLSVLGIRIKTENNGKDKVDLRDRKAQINRILSLQSDITNQIVVGDFNYGPHRDAYKSNPIQYPTTYYDCQINWQDIVDVIRKKGYSHTSENDSPYSPPGTSHKNYRLDWLISKSSVKIKVETNSPYNQLDWNFGRYNRGFFNEGYFIPEGYFIRTDPGNPDHAIFTAEVKIDDE